MYNSRDNFYRKEEQRKMMREAGTLEQKKMVLSFAETIQEISALVRIANDDRLEVHADALIFSLK